MTVTVTADDSPHGVMSNFVVRKIQGMRDEHKRKRVHKTFETLLLQLLLLSGCAGARPLSCPPSVLPPMIFNTRYELPGTPLQLLIKYREKIYLKKGNIRHPCQPEQWLATGLKSVMHKTNYKITTIILILLS